MDSTARMNAVPFVILCVLAVSCAVLVGFDGSDADVGDFRHGVLDIAQEDTVTSSILAEKPVIADGEIDLYGFKANIGLIDPKQVDSVEWDFGDGTKETVKITSENSDGKVQHTYSAKGDYNVVATMKNKYVNDAGEVVDGESKLYYVLHILGYPVVTFVSNGGSDVASIEGTSSYFVAAKPNDPIKEGSTFSGWFIDSECTQTFDWSSEVTKHITLYAGWDLVLHTVSFDVNGGQGTVSEVKVADGKSVSMPKTPVKDGFDFDGWFIGDEKYDFSAPVTSDITLTAHWAEKSDVPSDEEKKESGNNKLFFILIIALLLAAVFVIAKVLS